jgi:hypothetical protein
LFPNCGAERRQSASSYAAHNTPTEEHQVRTVTGHA